MHANLSLAQRWHLEISASLWQLLNDLYCVFTGQEFDVRAKCVINATGPFTDSLRKMDNQKMANICQPSAGVHIVIPGYYR